MNFGEFFNKIWQYIVNWFSSTYLAFEPEHIAQTIVNYIIVIYSILILYRVVYILVGVFGKAPKYKHVEKKKSFAVIIAARNEEKVIGNLIDSIKANKYPQDKITIFVSANNCTDNTALIARNHGAIVYEMNEKSRDTKGLGLQYLFTQIEKDYGIMSFEAYAFFDADNLVDPLFLDKMNDALEADWDVVKGYRDIKNFGTNLISSSYGFHFYRNVIISHRPRAVFHNSTLLDGTGFVCHNYIMKDGWNYVKLTEDAEFTFLLISNNKKIGYCEEAVFYDEQPHSIKVSLKQRARWAKGALDNFFENSHRLVKNLFKTGKFSNYDMYLEAFPYDILVLVLSIVILIIDIVFQVNTTGTYQILSYLHTLGTTLLTTYLAILALGILVLIRERKRIHYKWYKMVFYLLHWPIFDLISLPIRIYAIFNRKIKWDAIPHDDTSTLEEVNKTKDSGK